MTALVFPGHADDRGERRLYEASSCAAADKGGSALSLERGEVVRPGRSSLLPRSENATGSGSYPQNLKACSKCPRINGRVSIAIEPALVFLLTRFLAVERSGATISCSWLARGRWASMATCYGLDDLETQI
jgi:hypothetical protein